MERSGPTRVRDVLDNDTLTKVSVSCNNVKCRHSGSVLLSRFLDAGATLNTPVFQLREWCVCSKCGSHDLQTRTTAYPRGVKGVPHMKDV